MDDAFQKTDESVSLVGDFDDEPDEELLNDLRIGFEQIECGETVSIDEARTHLKKYLNARFGKREE